MNKEKIIEEFRYDYYQTGKLTYTEEDGSTRANPENIIDWWLSKFDSHTEELKKVIEEEPFPDTTEARMYREKILKIIRT